MDIPGRVREIRESLGVTQTELARRVGVARNHIGMIESGSRTPSIGLLEKIARALGTEPAEFLRDLPTSVEELLARQNAKTRHLADPNLADKFRADAGDEDVLQVVRELSAELEAVGPELVRFARYYSHNANATGIYSEVSKQFMIARYSIAARRGQEFVDARDKLDEAGWALAA
jgi:transcriptional regulator with XRE-family HTH domain